VSSGMKDLNWIEYFELLCVKVTWGRLGLFVAGS